MNSTIAISMGDPDGIGPEIILKSLLENGTHNSTPLIFGNESVFRFYAKTIPVDPDFNIVSRARDAEPGKINILNCTPFSKDQLEPGKLNTVCGRAAMESVAAGIEACNNGEADALVTAPISKEAISLAGYSVPGHTEYLAEKTATDHVLMMLVSGGFRVALATIHIPLRDVASALTPEKLTVNLRILHNSLLKDFGIKNPNIAVLGLNPHGGDGGIIGREEIEIIQPVIADLNRNGLNLSGPYAADGFFGKQLHTSFDAVFATYHDQGLIPFKALTFGKGVNFTAGLPIIRTSPDHGTAFDIAGKNSADHGSFDSAYRLAVDMANNRNKTDFQKQ